MRNIKNWIVVALAVVMTACGGEDYLTIDGQIKGAGSQNIVLTYYAKGGLQRSVRAANDGRFMFTCLSTTPTLAVVTLADGTQIASVIGQNGDKISIDADLGNLYATKVSGNAHSSQISDWVRNNAEILKSRQNDKINMAVADFVSHNADKLSSTALLVSYFNSEGYEAQADSLLRLLDVKVRRAEIMQGFNSVISAQLTPTVKASLGYLNFYGRCDSIISYNPRSQSSSILCVLPDGRAARDSVVRRLKVLTNTFSPKRFRPIEISTAPDSLSWIESLGKDTVSWDQTWVMGAVANMPLRSLSIPRLPYFIVADSTGTQLYRGTSITNAEKAIREILK